MRNTLFLTRFIALGLVLASVTLSSAHAADDAVIASDGGVAITRAEFEAAIADAPERVMRRAANDDGDRFEIINGMLTVRKLHVQAACERH